MRFTTIALASAISFTATATAQETYWIANRGSSDIMELSTWGSVLQRVAMGNSLRSAHQAPDGKVWVVRFIQSTVDIYDPATATTTGVAFSQGNAYDIAFDAAGTAWVSGGSGVENFDANGVSIASYPLTAGAPLGITVDADGNKWIAHRLSVGSVSRIDGTTGAVTNHVVSGGQPVRPIADYRGLFVSSHIWVTCDSGGSLIELDANGNELNNYTMPATTIGGVGPVFDLNGDIWVGSFSSGSLGALWQTDSTNGVLLNTYFAPPSCSGLSMDSLGRILSAARITFSGVGPPCEVSRIDANTGLLEMNTKLAFAGNNAAGTSSAASTPFQYALVVDPVGDLDGDGDANFAEITGGFYPADACSNSNVSISTSGTSNATTGGTVNVDVAVPSGTFWIAGIAQSAVAAGTGTTLPGIACEVLLNPTEFLGSVAGTTTGFSITIPADTSFIGAQFVFQALAVNSASALFVSNLTGVELF